jgi:2-polyprenyl-6-hydroxyphenyl methylase/3-demethylubiquinone-9 3-methyltransferase
MIIQRTSNAKICCSICMNTRNLAVQQHRSQVHNQQTSTVDESEVEFFSSMARTREWWNPNGKLKTLHQINPFRMRYIRNVFVNHFQREMSESVRLERGIDLNNELYPFRGLRILDVGCGGGLASESLARLGASVIGIDVSYANISVANEHREYSLKGTDAYDRLQYRHSTAEKLLYDMELEGKLSSDEHLFDAVVSLEVIEHVSNLQTFVHSLAGFLKPGGALVMSTLNRTATSFVLAIAAAEYLLNLVPKGTHDWRKFLKPDELTLLLQSNGLLVEEIVGVKYNPLTENFQLTDDASVNYQLFARRPAMETKSA